jgi:peptidoglycan/LPS O-acetylase OafA/YrhL
VRAQGRDNNFNLVRLCAAVLVLVSHSWPLTGTLGEPLEGLAGFSLGHLGVDIFFVVSGFLVTGSLLARQSLGDFARARALRIFPALAVSAFGTAFLIGPLVTELPLGRYLTNPDTWRYALQNSVTWPFGVCWWLPGAFLQNPGGPAVNGALWSLPWELTMYVLLGLLGFVLLRERDQPAVERTRIVVIVVAAAATFGHGLNEALDLSHRFEVVQGLRLTALFFCAGTLQVLRTRVPLAPGPLGLSILGVLAALLLHGGWQVLYAPALTYLVVWLALVPAGPLRLYNRIGDYSYGFYLWQFPIQQWVVLRDPMIGPAALMALAGPMTLVLAALSWSFVEAPALRWKDRADGRAREAAAS